MRNLPQKPTEYQKKVIAYTTEIWGKLDRHAMNVALYVMNRRRGLELTEEEMEDVFLVRANMASKVGE